jgi:DNA topoisomerase-3
VRPHHIPAAHCPLILEVGTDATIAQHIETVINREYVLEEYEGGTKYLLPSTLGIGLIEGYNEMGLEKSVSKPQLRREVRYVRQVRDQD